MVEAAEIITFACDRPPKSTHCCSDVKTETLLRRGLLELGISLSVTRRTRDLKVDTEGGARRAVGVMRKRLCTAAKRRRRLGVIRCQIFLTKKGPASTAPLFRHVPALERRAWASHLPPCKASDRALRTSCAPSLACVCVSRLALPLVCPTARTPSCRPGLSRQTVVGFMAQLRRISSHARAQSLEAEPQATP